MADAEVAEHGTEDERLRATRTRLRHERARVRRLAAQVEALEGELATLRGSAAWRASYPLRRAATAVPPSLYMALRGKRRPAPAPPAPPPVLDGERPWALLVDDWFPEPDRDSGSIDIVNMAEALLALGFAVLFAARRDVAGNAASAVAALEARGVRTLRSSDAPDIERFLRREGAGLALVVLNRVYCGGAVFETVRRTATNAAVLFNTVDLHWVRLAREAALAQDAALAVVAEDARLREIELAREADAAFVVSAAEREMLEREAPDAFVVELPLGRRVVPPRAGHAAREGIGFIGGFRHTPNLDALRWFAAEIWPLVQRSLPDCRFSVVGSDLPAGLLDGMPGRVEALGHVSDIDPWFETLRLTVAPLRFGAGAKGKVASSLAAGVPCVGTTVAFEGMRLDGEGILAADTPDAMAAAIVRLHEDAALWSAASEAAVGIARARLSEEKWRARLADTLATLGAMPD